MKKLKIGFKDRSPKNVEIEGVTFFLKPMAQEVMAGLAMYTQGHRGSMMSLEEKKEFIKSHLTGWKEMYDEDGDEFEFSTQIAVEYLTHDDYDDLFMLLYWKAIELANEDNEKKERNKEEIKK